MTVQDAISSCQQLIEHATTSTLLQTLLVCVFIVIPVLRVLISIIKTNISVRFYLQNCSQHVPAKLSKILRRHRLPAKMFYFSCNSKFVAVSTGFFAKKIILSKSLIGKLSEKELEAIVLHEYQHLVDNHAIKIVFMELLSKTFFMFPVLKDVADNVRTNYELAADAAAVRKQKTTQYVKTSLRKVISSDSQLSLLPHFSYQTLESRIDVLNYQKPKARFRISRIFISTLSILVLSGIFAFNQTYAMTQTMEEMEERITCSIFDCVQQCVTYEFMNRAPLMSKNNISLER